ncbi:MAG: hypothetical protein IJK26_01335 [Clostridia bacterium]|nr:hypothetical protein [Clostridia bacterium]
MLSKNRQNVKQTPKRNKASGALFSKHPVSVPKSRIESHFNPASSVVFGCVFIQRTIACVTNCIRFATATHMKRNII